MIMNSKVRRQFIKRSGQRRQDSLIWVDGSASTFRTRNHVVDEIIVRLYNHDELAASKSDWGETA